MHFVTVLLECGKIAKSSRVKPDIPVSGGRSQVRRDETRVDALVVIIPCVEGLERSGRDAVLKDSVWTSGVVSHPLHCQERWFLVLRAHTSGEKDYNLQKYTQKPHLQKFFMWGPF